jgi:hypothetical protein
LIQILDGGAIFGGERFTKSGQNIVDNGANKTGFRLGADGRLIASNAEISGTVNASSGAFDSVTITGKSSFSGNIYSNAIISTDETISPGVEKTFSSGEGVKNVFRYYGYPSYDPQNDSSQIIDVASGSYGNYNDLIRIELRYKNHDDSQSNNTYTMVLYFRTNSAVIRFGTHNDPNPSIGNTLVIGGGASGKTLRFIDIPNGVDDDTEDGVVWRDNSGFLRIK